MLTLGLDLGPNSIGWAIIDKQEQKIHAIGSRIFPEGVNIDAVSKAESSRNEKRREYRQKRRQLFRRKFRNNLLRKALQQAGLIPELIAETDSFWAPCPYQLRSKAINEPIKLHELGRIIFHLNQRRGFKSNRKSAKAEDGVMEKGGNGKTGITQTIEAWQEGGFKTFGAYLASLDPHEQRIRNRYTLRQWYEQELEQIWQEQQKYYPDVLTDELRQKLTSPDSGIIFYQRPLRSQKHLVGKCTLEPKKPRCPLSHPEFEEFRMWQIINNLEVAGPGRFKELLDDEEKSKLVELFNTKEKIKISDIRKKLKLTEDYTFNYDDSETFNGSETSIKLLKLFGKNTWEALSDLDKTLPEESNKDFSKLDVWHLFFFAEDPKWLHNYAKEKWGFDDKQLKALGKTHLKEGYASLSLKAIRKILPFLRKGEKYDKAAKLAGYHHSNLKPEHENLAELQEPKNLRNPIVQQALYELRKLVNQLIKQYGKPATILIELARDLKVSKEKRAQIRKEQFWNRDRNEKARNSLIENGISRPSRIDIEKYHLWEECNRKCPYTGKEISFNDLFINGRFDIEHILPYSRTLDDSLANKTLCEKGFNIGKGNKTPHELLSGDPVLYQQVLDRVQNLVVDKKV